MGGASCIFILGTGGLIAEGVVGGDGPKNYCMFVSAPCLSRREPPRRCYGIPGRDPAIGLRKCNSWSRIFVWGTLVDQAWSIRFFEDPRQVYLFHTIQEGIRSMLPLSRSSSRSICLIGDMVGLLDALGTETAVIVGHD